MILRRAILLACGVTALAAAAGVAVIALAFALYSALAPLWGPALAAAGVAGACVLLGVFGATVALIMARAPAPQRVAAPEGLAARGMGLAREHPILAALALGAVGLIAARNPKITATLVGAFLAAKPAPKR